MTQDWILRGRDWLESCQNNDGGWGETCGTYENPSTKGIGESTASQTAWAIMGMNVFLGLRFGVWGKEDASAVTAAANRLLSGGLR